jgi:hypothetical protein
MSTTKQPTNVLSTSIKSQFKSNPLTGAPKSHTEESAKTATGENFHSSKVGQTEGLELNSPLSSQKNIHHVKIPSTNVKKGASNSVGSKTTKDKQPATSTTNAKSKMNLNPMFNSNPTHPTSLETNESQTNLKHYNSANTRAADKKLNKKQPSASSIPKESTNIVTTNFTENNKENTMMKENEFLETQNIDDKLIIDKKNYMANKDKVNISNRSDQAEADNILSHIEKMRFLFKSNEINMNKLLKNEENQRQITQLNLMLNAVTLPTSSNNTNSSDYKKVNVINSNMLSNEFLSNQTGISKEIETTTTPIKEERSESKFKPQNTENKINNEIFINSDLRIKRYGILLDFINSNLRDINEMVCNRNHDASRDLYKIDEVNSNKLSSLHSRINLNSRTNLLEKENIYDYEDEEMQEFTTVHIPKNKILTQYKNQIVNPHPMRNTIIQDINKSLISSIYSEFYQDLIDGSFLNIQSFLYNNNNNVSDISSIRINEKVKLDKFFSDIDQTQYLFKRNSLPPDEKAKYIDGEENIESDGDRTKEHIQIGDPSRLPMYNHVVKDMDRNKVDILS